MIERILNYFGYFKIKPFPTQEPQDTKSITAFIDLTKLNVLSISRHDGATIIGYIKEDSQFIHQYGVLCQ